jgi:amidase
MSADRPTRDQLRAVADELGLELGPQELDFFHAVVQPSFAAHDALEMLPDNIPLVTSPRPVAYRPRDAENPHNAWYVKTKVEGAAGGPLAGKTLALKDNICLAGTPMTNGSPTLEGYVPDVDATVVTRVLEAGATILGKANCESFCLSAGSHTNATGPTHNPLRRGYTSGGSSSGCAALVAAGDVDMALGGDQGGSIRIPASYCGIYGLKPTHGLVPYSGIMPLEASLDHVGPMTRTVADNARLLSEIAGPDGLDPRQAMTNDSGDSYVAALTTGAEGLRIGILEQGFGHRNSEADVDAAVRGAAEAFGRLGAIVSSVSIPMHAVGPAIWLAIASEGIAKSTMDTNALGYGWKGLYVTSLREAHAGWRRRSNDLSDSLKMTMLIGGYSARFHQGRYYAKAQNLSRRLRAVYDEAFSRFDLLLLPTSPIKAPLIPADDASRLMRLRAAAGDLSNTQPFNCTGHPAMSVPCGISDELPIGMMLVARHYNEATIYRAAAAYERSNCVPL